MFPGDVRFAFIYDEEIKENEEGGKRGGREWKERKGRDSNAAKKKERGGMQTRCKHAYGITHTQILSQPQEGVRPKTTLITDEYLQ